MDKSSASNKSKLKSAVRPKPKNKTKRKLKRDVLKYLQVPALLSSSSSLSSLQQNPIKTMATCTKSIINYLQSKFRLKMHDFLRWKICTGITVLSSLLSMVKANSSAVTSIGEATGYTDNLVVCLPLNSNSCITYVNSPINGLIELNETLYPALKAFRGSYDYQMIARINPFWLTFEPPSNASYFIMGVLYTIMFSVGVTGNGLVIYMFARCKALRTASYILVLNLALSDIMIITMCPMAAYNNFMRGPALGDLACRVFGFVGGFSGTASIGMLTVIALDRYSVVVKPLRLNYKTNYYYVLLTIVWLDSLLFSMIPLCEIGLSTYVPEGYLTTCSFDYLDSSTDARIFMFVFFLFAWFIPLVIICYCYFHIIKAVLSSKNIQSNKNKHQIEVRLAMIVLLVIGLWFLAWTPYALVTMAGIFNHKEYLTSLRSMIPALFCKTAACLNPFLYTISHKRFRNELQRLFCKRPPIYQYSMTRSSYFTRSSKRTRNRVDLNNDAGGGAAEGKTGVVDQSGYKMNLDTHRKNITRKISPDKIDAGSSAYAGDQHETNVNYRTPKDINIFVLDISPDTEVSCRTSPPPQQLETDF